MTKHHISVGIILILLFIGLSGCQNVGRNSLMFTNNCNEEIHIDFRVQLKEINSEGNETLIVTGYEFLTMYLPHDEKYLFKLDSSGIEYDYTKKCEYVWYVSVYSNVGHSMEDMILQRSRSPHLNTDIADFTFHQDGNVSLMRKY